MARGGRRRSKDCFCHAKPDNLGDNTYTCRHCGRVWWNDEVIAKVPV
jgi:hypothetical protein